MSGILTLSKKNDIDKEIENGKLIGPVLTLALFKKQIRANPESVFLTLGHTS